MIMNPHSPTVAIQRLQDNIARFVEVIRALSTDVFLRPVTAWSPRDVTAHLIGWNHYTLEGIEGIRQGISPAYLLDYPNDFATVNAASVQKYAARDKTVLLGELAASATALLARVQQLPEAEWMHDFGARNPIGRPVYIQRQVDGLSDDYLAHAQEVEQWANAAR
jgi:hypothetical protein